MIDHNDPTVAKLLPAALGSLVSLKFITGKWHEKLLMFVGGAASSFYAGPPVTKWMGTPDWIGFIAFLLGFLGMMLMAKAYEVLTLIDAATVAKDLWEIVKRKWGA